MAKRMTEDELKALVGTELRSSLGYTSSKLSNARLKAENYYLGLPVGDLTPPEIDGRSSVVSTDVRDTIEAMLPQLMVTFCGSDLVAEFEPQGPDDEQKATQATEYVNHLFYRKNPGHRIAYTWMKDALLQKNGIVKVWWDTRNEESREEYRALSDVELAQILDDEEVEVVEQSSYPDEQDAKQRAQALEQIGQQLAQAMQAAQQGNQQAAQQAQQLQQQMAGIQAQPPKMLYDIAVKRVKTEGKITIENVPPEEFLINRNAKDIATARFVGHRVQRSVSELKSMGYKGVDDLSGEDNGQAMNLERIGRLQWNDENAWMSDQTSGDDSQRLLWVTECYVRCDYDGDGIAELRKVTTCGNDILDNEEVDVCPFVSITPVPLPHTFFGLSIADLAMESQKTKTSILRAQLDQLYLGVNGRYFAVENQVNLDDLLTSRPGGVVRVKQPGAVGRLDQGAGDVGFSLQMMEYMTQDLENRTGWSRQSMGNDAGGIKTQTATAANIVTNKADMRLDLIARNFAEGFVDMFKLVLRLVCQHQNKPAIVKLTGGWTPIDPREWRNQFDVTINVGLGTGSKDQRVQHLMMLLQLQREALQIGVVNPQNILASAKELATLLGYRNSDKFFTDPSKAPPQPPKPDPEMQKAQAQMQIEQAKLQANQQLEQMKLQQQVQLDDVKRQHEMQLEQAKMQLQAQVDTNRQQAEADQKALEMQQQAELDAIKAQHEAEKHANELEFNRWKAELDSQTRILVAQIAAGQRDEASGEEEEGKENEEANATSTAQALATALQGFTEALSALNRPKQVVRGPDGRVQGIV